jgi:endonuclease-3
VPAKAQPKIKSRAHATPAAKKGATPARARDIEKRLSQAMPEPRVELDHQNAWQLLIATILSAQSTDRTVNRVTPALFKRYPTPAKLAAAEQAVLETMVKSTGFFRNKAKSIKAASQAVAEQFDGEVPRTMEEMITLPGVARKTANVVLGSAYRIPSGIVVDTHVGRVTRRLGLTKHDDPVKVERDLCEVYKPSSWIDMGHRLLLHGRYVCLATRPRCADCPLNELCHVRQAEPVLRWTQRADHERVRVESRGAAST